MKITSESHGGRVRLHVPLDGDGELSVTAVLDIEEARQFSDQLNMAIEAAAAESNRSRSPRTEVGLTPCIHGKRCAAACNVCGVECMHHVMTGQCPACLGRVRGFPERAWVTPGGDAFHSTKDCRLLKSGQDYAAAKELPVYRVEEWSVAKAIREGRHPCSRCFPPKRFRSAS